ISYGLNKSPALYDLLVRDAEFTDTGIVETIPPDAYALPNAKMPDSGKLFVVAGNRETRLIAQAMEGEPFGIRTRMLELAQENIVDYVIFDTSPTPSTLHAMIYLATDHIIYPTEVTYLSFDGLMASIRNTTGYSKQKQQQGFGEIKLTGVVPTKFRSKTLEHQENLKSLKKGLGELVWNPLPMSVVWEEATARKRSIFRYAYDHPAAADAWKVVRTVKEKVSNG